MQPLFILHKHYRDAVEVCEIALNAALSLDNADAEKSMRKRLARFLVRLGEVGPAESHVAEMLRKSRARGDRRGEASGLKSLGMLKAERSEFDAAARLFAEALAILRELGKRRGEGLVLIELGMTLAALGRLDDAAEHLEQAHTVLTEDTYNAMRASAEMGRVQAQLGNFADAQALLGNAVTAFGELGARHEQARTHAALAEVLTHLGQSAEAQRHRDAAGEILATEVAPIEGE
jgi:tetratricopeptide (TPR) repeat protein